MNRYGQIITWGTVGAPHPFQGTCTSYTYRDQRQRQLDTDENGENQTLIQHSQKADISFVARVTEKSTNFLDLSAGAALTLAGMLPFEASTGVILATRATERWSLGQPKTASIQGTYYPDMSIAGSDGKAGPLDAFVPTQILPGLITPGGRLIYGTSGITHATGIVHMLEINQVLQITEDDPSPEGKILGAASYGYLRTISMDILVRAAIPASGDPLSISILADRATDYKIESVETKFQEKRGKMISITAVWFPRLTT